MRRKIIKQGHNTLTLTLPSKWTERNKLRQGDEVVVDQKDNLLIIKAEESNIHENISVDISNLDRCSILYSIRNLYRVGYDEIEIKYANEFARYYRQDRDIETIKVVMYEVNNLIGIELFDQQEGRVVLKEISSIRDDDFDSILRRIFLILNESGQIMLEAMAKNDTNQMSFLKEKHDIATKFVSYCLRILNKSGVDSVKKRETLYHVISFLDKIADIYRNVWRNTSLFAPKYSKKSIIFAKDVVDAVSTYYNLFYKFSPDNMVKLNMIRDNYMKKMKKEISNLTKEEIIVIKDLNMILEIISDLIVAKMGLDA